MQTYSVCCPEWGTQDIKGRYSVAGVDRNEQNIEGKSDTSKCERRSRLNNKSVRSKMRDDAIEPSKKWGLTALLYINIFDLSLVFFIAARHSQLRLSSTLFRMDPSAEAPSNTPRCTLYASTALVA
jgi:hypothetical protein